MKIKQRIEQIIDQIQALRAKCYPQYELSIEYLTIFSQSEEDFINLKKSLKELGEEAAANNGFKYNLKTSINYKGENINLIRIRKLDIHRKELGCADLTYKDQDYTKLREIALEKGLDIILRNGYEMIELSDFDMNVYAYLVKDL
jgi:hypothetical protein